MSKSIDETKEYQYHSNIHRDEEYYHEAITPRYFITPQTVRDIPTPAMKLSANYNRLTTFAISQVDTSNAAYFTSLFNKLAEEAKKSDHKIIFSGLDELTEHVVIFNELQREILDLMYLIQESTESAIHIQKIQLTV